VAGSTLRARPPEEKTMVVAVRDHVWPLIAAGRVGPVIDRILPLDEAAAAHRLVDAGGHVGKVLLAV
jgi:NADPH:quinone reductase-like Zn-dependent oxidoreductase